MHSVMERIFRFYVLLQIGFSYLKALRCQLVAEHQPVAERVDYDRLVV